MHQHNFDVLIQEEEERFNKLEREEIISRYISISPPYYRKDRENEEFEQRAQNFEPPIRYVVEQETIIQGVKMSRGSGVKEFIL
jgi:hypothetical protein